MQDNIFVLFNVDGILVSEMGVKGEAFAHVFKEIFGINVNISEIGYQGLTDREIIFRVLRNNGLSNWEITIKLRGCFEILARYYNIRILTQGLKVLDGVQVLLDELQSRYVGLGLITGNIELVAKAKLRRVKLDTYFGFGGFGDRNMDRAGLVRFAIQQAQKRGCFDINRVFVVGDTPADIRAGKKSGIKTIGVATGHFSGHQFVMVGADHVFRDLVDYERFMEIVLMKTGRQS